MKKSIRIKNRTKIINKYLRYFKATITYLQPGIIQIGNYDIYPNFEWKYQKDTEPLIFFECHVCKEFFEIKLNKRFLDNNASFSGDYREIEPLIQHIKLKHPKVRMVPRCLIDAIKRNGANFSYSHYYWCDIGDFSDLIPGDEYHNCLWCDILDKKHSFCKSHIEFIKYPERSKCSMLRSNY